MKKRSNEDRPMRSLTMYVVFSILVILVYTVVEQILSATTGVTHDTLTTCFFACFGGEVLMCGLIKIFKLKSKEDENNEE